MSAPEPVVVSRDVGGHAADVWAVLSDGWTYAGWVVGSARIRDVDTNFPTAGSRIHHSVGMWPFLIDDHTDVLAAEPDRRLHLRVRAWPAGAGEVEVALEDHGDGTTRVTMAETPVSGPGRWAFVGPTPYLLRRRNVESLRRLAGVVERRVAPPDA